MTAPPRLRRLLPQLTEFEPKRAAQFGIDHYCWICLNPKEAEDLGKAKEVLARFRNS